MGCSNSSINKSTSLSIVPISKQSSKNLQRDDTSLSQQQQSLSSSKKNLDTHLIKSQLFLPLKDMSSFNISITPSYTIKKHCHNVPLSPFSNILGTPNIQKVNSLLSPTQVRNNKIEQKTAGIIICGRPTPKEVHSGNMTRRKLLSIAQP